MRVLDKSTYVYEVEVESSSGLGEPIFTFNTSIRLEGVENEYPLRMRIRAYYASFRPHSNILNLSQPGDWSEWSDWLDSPDASFDEAAIEARNNLA